jgi:hypothetical protein
MWNGFDLAGRSICPDSFNTKSAGCNSASDRLIVENEVSRPQYIPYINLSMEGVTGNSLYADDSKIPSHHTYQHHGGAFGQQMASHVKPSGLCAYDTYQQNQAVDKHHERACQGGMTYLNNSAYRELGGYY